MQAKATKRLAAGRWSGEPADRIRLDYEGRLLRRRRLVAQGGLEILVDLPQPTSFDDGDALMLEDGRTVAISAAEEALIEVRGDLPRFAWHIGNRHTPCQIEANRLVIRQDHVLADMLRRLGADLVDVTAAFRPEGGAYGHGRTHGHEH